ncbi:MAG TPA: HAD family hydrolase [Candidatus Nanoarchaeia archaeon]|nr:HAD family hydrolase [Candidatus Nanoarchaeia archaeon]
MKTILVDGMFCVYDENFNVNKELLHMIDSFRARKILVVNKFREKGKKLLENSSIKHSFSLEEENINKDNKEYFLRLLKKFDINPKEVFYFDHDENNVKTAKSVGINSVAYSRNNLLIKQFIIDNL